MIKLLIYTTSPVMVVGLRSVLSEAKDIELHIASTDVEEFTAFLSKLEPDVVLIESSPEIHIGILAGLRRKAPSTRIIVWAHRISVDVAHSLREIGVCGFLRKDTPVELTLRCIRHVAGGEVWFERSLMNEFLGTRKVKLSKRERQLLALISQGCSNQQIAERLFLAEGTISVYLSKLFKKVGVGDRYELAMFGLRSMDLFHLDASVNFSSGELWPPTLVVRDSARHPS